jgi:LacI family transcriptional regulator
MLPRTIAESDMLEWAEQRGLEYADGLFITPSIVPVAWEPILFGLAVPKILLNFPPSGTRMDSVVWDIYEASFQSVAYLHSIGHRNIMYVGDTDAKRGFILRWQAFQQAMKKFGLEVDPSAHSIGEHSNKSSWLQELRSQILHYRPSAILCGIDEEVPDIVSLCEQLDLHIPEQLSLVALLNEQPDSLPLFTRPLLSIRATGYRAADRMLWRIANPTLPYEHTRIQGDFEVGNTTAPPLAGS